MKVNSQAKYAPLSEVINSGEVVTVKIFVCWAMMVYGYRSLVRIITMATMDILTLFYNIHSIHAYIKYRHDCLWTLILHHMLYWLYSAYKWCYVQEMLQRNIYISYVHILKFGYLYFSDTLTTSNVLWKPVSDDYLSVDRLDAQKVDCYYSKCYVLIML